MTRRGWWWLTGAALVICAHHLGIHWAVQRGDEGRLLCEPLHDWGGE